MMKPEIKAKWVEALRSGKYQQGTKRLRRLDNHFCCLGVLCDIIDNTKWNLTAKDSVDSFGYDGYHCTLPEYLSKELGIYGKSNILASMNDQGASFEFIADYIEENI